MTDSNEPRTSGASGPADDEPVPLMQRLLLLGLNHATAPLELREKLAFTAEERSKALDALR